VHCPRVPPVAAVPEQLRQGVFRGSAVVGRGLLTPNQLRGPAWRRLFEDVYIHVDRPVSHALRARAAASMVVPGSVVTGRSAAVLWGVELASVGDEVELTVPPSWHPRRIPGVRVRRAVLPAGHVQQRRGVPVTSVAATGVRLAASLAQDDAVVAIDQLVSAGLADLSSIRELVLTTHGPGSARARRACALADGRAESPQETRLRLLIGRSRLSPPVAQFTVRHGGRFVARVDFAWPEKRVAVEYDGLWHAEDGQFARDRQRLNRLHAAGWRVFFVTATDLHHPGRLIARLTEFLAEVAVVR
jgi:very-short-patch-repair endonuclease